MQLFYSPDICSDTEIYRFDKDESKHIVKVLRKKEGDSISITNGKGYLFSCEIILASEKKCEVKILNSELFRPSEYHLHLAVAPTKLNDRYEWFLEKATEIGIHEITPIICEHSERKEVKIERFQKVILAAMKQSLHYYLPKLNQPISLSAFLAKANQGQLFIAHCEETDKKELAHQVASKQPVTVLIGPEGDFSEREIKKAISVGFLPVALGETRLRTETAAVYATVVVAVKQEAD